MSQSAGLGAASADLSGGKTRPTIPLRAWATPLTIGAFFLMAVTGDSDVFWLAPGIDE